MNSHDILVKETPAKVSTLGLAAIFSLFMLFSVSFTEASFEKVANPLPNPFGPEKVMAVIDNTAWSLNILAQDFTGPVRQAVAFHSQGFKEIIQDSDRQIVAALGLEVFVPEVYISPNWQFTPHSEAKVAGAAIQNNSGFNEEPEVEVLE